MQTRSLEYLSPQPYFGENDDIDLFFPDGTWCHNEGNEDYFCLKHQCVSESQSRQPRKNSDKPEVQILQNAQIEGNEPHKTVLEYFTVDKNGNPKSEAKPKSDKDSHKDDDKTDFPQVKICITILTIMYAFPSIHPVIKVIKVVLLLSVSFAFFTMKSD